MTITIGPFTFDNVFYDAEVDVLYLHKGDPSSAAAFDESPEATLCASMPREAWSG